MAHALTHVASCSSSHLRSRSAPPHPRRRIPPPLSVFKRDPRWNFSALAMAVPSRPLGAPGALVIWPGFAASAASAECASAARRRRQPRRPVTAPSACDVAAMPKMARGVLTQE
jgi:hypothetical protein